MKRVDGYGRVDRSAPLAFTFDGVALRGFRGDTLASALLANGVDVVGRIDDPARDAVDDRLGRTAARPGQLRDTGRRRLEEHDAEPFLFEAEPSVATQHGEHVGGAVVSVDLLPNTIPT